MKLIIASFLTQFAIAASAQQKIKPEEVAKHIGDSTTVCGKVFGGVYLDKSNGQPTLLNIGGIYPDNPFTAVIYGEHRPLFKNAPETYYKDSVVCVTGKIVEYRGKPQIVLQKPAQLFTEH
jgi:hypothetical protein